jgi:hypothetical protein
MEYLKNILKVEPANGEAWGNLGMPSAFIDAQLVSHS